MNKQTLLRAIGKKVIHLREQKKWSQADLARACNKDPQSVERIENAKTNPTIYYLQEIADGLEVELKELFDF